MARGDRWIHSKQESDAAEYDHHPGCDNVESGEGEPLRWSILDHGAGIGEVASY
jgi:hypothetical protein